MSCFGLAETIPDAAHRFYCEIRVKVREFFAKERHIHFKVVGLEFAVESPCFEYKIFFCGNEVGIFEKVSQKFKFFAGQIDRAFLRRERESCEIERSVLIFEFVVRKEFSASSEHRAYTGGEFVEREGF